MKYGDIFWTPCRIWFFTSLDAKSKDRTEQTLYPHQRWYPQGLQLETQRHRNTEPSNSDEKSPDAKNYDYFHLNIDWRKTLIFSRDIPITVNMLPKIPSAAMKGMAKFSNHLHITIIFFLLSNSYILKRVPFCRVAHQWIIWTIWI